MKNFLLVIMSFSAGFLFAQDKSEHDIVVVAGEYTRMIDKNALNNTVYNTFIFDAKNNEVMVGSQYLYENFTSGKIMDREGNTIDVLVRYDAFNDEVQVQDNGKVVALLPSKIKAVGMNNQIFIYALVEGEKGKQKPGYVEVLAEGDMALYLRRGIYTYKPNNRTMLGNRLNNETEIRTKETYYYSKNHKKLQSFKLKKKDIFKIFADDKLVEEIIKKHGLNIKDIRDVVQLFGYYNMEKAIK